MHAGRSLSRTSSPWGCTASRIQVRIAAAHAHCPLIDTAYGRWTLPHHPPHRTLLEDEEISHTFRRLFLPPYSDFSSLHEAFETTAITYSEDVRLVPEEIKSGVEKGGRWIFYSVWEMKREPRGGWEGQGKGRGHDVVLVHGLYPRLNRMVQN